MVEADDAYTTLKQKIRRAERAIRRLNRNGGFMPTLQEELIAKLPEKLMPGNVGTLKDVRWNYDFPFTFDLGVNPTLGPTTRVTQYFQVPQEAAFVLTHLGRVSEDDTTAGDLAPLQLEIRDRQSSRQFMSAPIPIQSIGKKYRPTVLPAKMIFMPSAFVDITLSTWLTNTQTTTGPGKWHFVIYGVRIRIENAKDVLGTVFQ